jgi:hypothetical protein
MALSAAARAALEQFKSQQATGSPLIEPLDDELEFNDEGDGSSLPTLPDGRMPGAGIARNSAANDRLADLNATSAVNVERLSAGTSGLFRPEQPKTFKESGISYRVLESLVSRSSSRKAR